MSLVGRVSASFLAQRLLVYKSTDATHSETSAAKSSTGQLTHIACWPSGFGVDDEEEDPVAALRPGIRSTAAADDVDADLPGPGLDDDLDIVADEEEEDNLLV